METGRDRKAKRLLEVEADVELAADDARDRRRCPMTWVVAPGQACGWSRSRDMVAGRIPGGEAPTRLVVQLSSSKSSISLAVVLNGYHGYSELLIMCSDLRS